MGDDNKATSEPASPAPPATAEQDQETPTWRAVKIGAKWGSIAGFILSNMIIAANSIDTPFGSIYAGNMFAVFAVCIGLFTALGAGIGWLSAQKIDEEDASPPSFPQEPFG